MLRIKSWTIPVFVLLGLGIAGYLAYIEITHNNAVCGPIGECNLVQASPYAQLFGIPIAVLGLLSYLSIGVLWGIQKYSDSQLASLSILGLLA